MVERMASWVGGLINNTAIRFGPRLRAKPISFHDFGSGKPPWVQFEIENYGKTAAYELVVGGVCLIEPHTISGTLSFPDKRIIKNPPIKLAARSVVQVEVRKPHLPSEDEFHILKDGSWRLCAFVLLSYRDFFNTYWQKCACFEIQMDLGTGKMGKGVFAATFAEVVLRARIASIRPPCV
jgi:hypothetical protein